MASAHAQCAPTDKIYIDPRLVPQRPQISPGQATRLLLPSEADQSLKRQLIEQFRHQNDPIVIPYGTGKVLVHPTNPCIQQYIP